MSENAKPSAGGKSEAISAHRTEELKRIEPLLFRPSARQRLLTLAVWSTLFALTLWCVVEFDITPARLWEGLGKLGRIVSLMLPPSFSGELLAEASLAIGETVAMAFLGTILGASVAFPLSLFGAKNIMRVEWLRLSARRGYDVVRAFEQLILALIFIRAFGLGPLAGVLAIAVSEVGTLAKLFSEAIENTSRRPVEGVMAAGGGRLQVIRYALLPQVLPVLISNVLYQFESNTRSATILGIVGAGGIGFMLNERIRAFQWADVATIALILVVAVALIDTLSARLRGAVQG